MKKVSVIIPCYNHSQFIEEAISSVANQTYKNIEIVCIDDGSTDNSIEIVQNILTNTSNIKLIKQENQGVIKARNAAISISNGDYILPLDADDKIAPTYIEKAVDILDKNPQIGIVYCNAQYFGNKTGKWQLPDFDKNEIIFANQIFSCALFRKLDFDNAGKYKEYMNKGLEDWDLWLTFIENGLSAYKIEETLFFYRVQNKESRTNLANSNLQELNKSILNKHLNLYLNNDRFYQKVFAPNLSKKIKKYKKLLHLGIYVILLEFLIVLIILFNSVQGNSIL